MIRLPVFVVLWFGFELINIPAVLLGVVVVPFLYRYRRVHYDELPWWARPWANPEDWEGHGNGNNSLPLWWIKSRGNTFREFYWYHAIRNPANGLRSYEWLDLDIVPELVQFRTNVKMDHYEPAAMRELGLSTTWHLSWIGWQAGFDFTHIWNDERYFNLKIGWRVEPSDSWLELSGIGIDDASFATKLLVWRKW